MNITVVNCYHDSNKGSCAIAWGLLNRLKTISNLKSITLISMFSNNSLYYKSSFRHLKNKFPECTFLSSPLLSWTDAKKLKKDKIYRPLHILFNCFQLKISWKSYCKIQDHRQPAIKAILQSDLVIDRGGPFFAASTFPINLSLYFYSWPFLLARKAGIPYGFSPESVGPFNNFVSKRFIKNLFNDAGLVTVRENISKSELINCGLSEMKIKTMLDNAFWVDPYCSDRVNNILSKYNLKPKQFLAVTCRAWHKEKQLRYNKELAQTIDRLVPDVLSKVILVPHMYDPDNLLEDDMGATLQLYNMIKTKKVNIITDDLGPDEIAALFGKAGLLIGTRLHSLILALKVGTPIIPVSYGGPKTKGIMELLGLGEFLFEMDGFYEEEVYNTAILALNSQKGIVKEVNGKIKKDDRDFAMILETILDKTKKSKQKDYEKEHGSTFHLLPRRGAL
jgi:colanic acid/amylovoran biosynthesis protein